MRKGEGAEKKRQSEKLRFRRRRVFLDHLPHDDNLGLVRYLSFNNLFFRWGSELRLEVDELRSVQVRGEIEFDRFHFLVRLDREKLSELEDGSDGSFCKRRRPARQSVSSGRKWGRREEEEERTSRFPFGRLHPGEKSDGFLLVALGELGLDDGVPGGSETVDWRGDVGEGSGRVETEGMDEVCCGGEEEDVRND